jgi:predicted peroxiredoxin
MRSATSGFCDSLYLLTACALLAGYAPALLAEEDPQRIVVHLSHYSDDLHAVNMALELGTMLADSGAAVTLFADLEGARLGDRRSPRSLRWGSGKPVSELFNAFVDAGGNVVLCPHCANAAGISEDDLRDGARIGTPEEIAALLLAADKILDY